MGNVSVKVPGAAGKTKTAQMHRAVADGWRRAMEAKRPKPKPAQRRTFAHIRDYREMIK